MSERPNVVLACLLAAAATFTTLILSGLSVLGGTGVAGLATVILGAFTACAFFLGDLAKVPLPALALVALASASLLGLGRTALAYARELRLLRSLPLEPIDDEALLGLAREGGVDVFVTPARRPAAFCFGVLRPRVVFTAGLLARLDPEEQAAAVLHEIHHAREREPLKCLLAKLAASAFFWVPALRDLLDRYLLTKELTADRLAADRTSRRALAGALAEVMGVTTPASTVGLAEFAAARVDRLFDPAVKLPPLFRRPRLLASAVAVTTLALLSLFPTRLDLAQTAQLREMLTSMSLHGLPGMAAGLAVNAAMLALLAYAWRRLVCARR